MSVTFAAAFDPTTTVRVFRLTCEALGVLGEWVGLENAHSEAQAHALVCTDSLCQGYGADVDEVSDLPVEVNMANANAVLVLNALGYLADGELIGEDDADAFLGRVLMALAVAPHDEGVPAHGMVSGEGLLRGGRQINCGRRPGYLQDQLGALRTLAEDCARRGLPVSWC